MKLLELANAYRTMASGILARPYVIRRMSAIRSRWLLMTNTAGLRCYMYDDGLSLIQEGLRGVVRIPGGTAHAPDSGGFPMSVMGKAGTTSDLRDGYFNKARIVSYSDLVRGFIGDFINNRSSSDILWRRFLENM